MRSLARLRTEFEACLFRLGHFLLAAPDAGSATGGNSNTSSNAKGHGRRKSSTSGGGGGGGSSSGGNNPMQSSATKARRRDRFLENNYALIGTVLEGVEGRMAEEMRGYFEGLRAGLAGDAPEE